MIISQKEEIYTTVHGEEIVLLDMMQGMYFGLEGASAKIWEELGQGPVAVSAILEKWKDVYDQTGDELESLLSQSVQELIDKRLVVVES
ncbi:PqqD family protein [Paenibacillus alvei]|uniref:Coenzyme PQQ synthesis protein D (PqqD) n=1 Tax=Paenibacillus alvei TaxID=44250 RepID=A0A383R5Q5_PAEAL|nr:PqqD family protein [Paenibacillus alvei]SYX82415.1 conserved protein of unknown function [Paenibacillus alvei]